MKHSTRTRSLLFIPGNTPRHFRHISDSGADMVIFDLEDSVGTSDKAQARQAVLRQMESPGPGWPPLAVRINSLYTIEGVKDCLALVESQARPAYVIMPKVQTADEILWLQALLTAKHAAIKIIPTIEVARGFQRAEQIADASPRVGGLFFGAGDLHIDTGIPVSWEAMLYARSRVIMAAALSGLPAFDTPYPQLHDDVGLAEYAVRSAHLGMRGMAALHPRQVPAINQAFSPTEGELLAAQRIVDATREQTNGAFQVNGQIVAPPIIEAARLLLERAKG